MTDVESGHLVFGGVFFHGDEYFIKLFSFVFSLVPVIKVSLVLIL